MKTYSLNVKALIGVALLMVQACGQAGTSQTKVSNAMSGAIACQAGNDGDGQLERVCSDIQVTERASNSLIDLVPFKLTLLATLKAPVANGQTLQATDVILGSKNQAIVSFNVAGNVQMGALDMIDVSDASKPVLSSQVILPSSDINGLARSGDRIYAVGASTTLGAVLNTVDIVNNKLVDSSISTFPLPSYAGTSVSVSNNVVAIASGDTGGIQTFNASALGTPMMTRSVADARAVRFDNAGKLMVLSGQPGAVRAYSGSGTLAATHALGGNAIAESKSTIEVHDSVYVASLGDAGAKIVCSADGGTLASIAAVTVPGLPTTRTVTNAATLSGGLLFTANGEAGVIVYTVQTNGRHTGACDSIVVTELGALALGTGFSANNVYYSKGNLFVASGSGGLMILRLKYDFLLNDFIADLLQKVGVDSY